MQPIWPLAAALAHLQAAYLEVLSPMAIPSPHAWRALESVLSGVPSPERWQPGAVRLGAGGLPGRIGERFSQAVCCGPWACLERLSANPFQLLFFTDFFARDPLILGVCLK
uniref:Uncharacterized protein n=1 Tax=Rangifer tarandus platyrhynchus TaxID=3082113 RepID=A0ACB0F7U9_RANTA|nr:unnamed protein product [Rangifer tarandus platyrhynchus]